MVMYVATHASPTIIQNPYILTPPKIASILSEVLGRQIVHVDLSPAELEQRHQEFGMPANYAAMMSAMDTSIKFGSEDRTNDVVLAVTGAAPRRFRDLALSVKEVWEVGHSA